MPFMLCTGKMMRNLQLYTGNKCLGSNYPMLVHEYVQYASFFLFFFEWRWGEMREMRHMHLIIASIMNALIEQLNDLMQALFMHLKRSFCCILQILVSCFVKTSHHEEYLCVKVRISYIPP